MARRYDSRTTIFSPEGRLYQARSRRADPLRRAAPALAAAARRRPRRSPDAPLRRAGGVRHRGDQPRRLCGGHSLQGGRGAGRREEDLVKGARERCTRPATAHTARCPRSCRCAARRRSLPSGCARCGLESSAAALRRVAASAGVYSPNPRAARATRAAARVVQDGGEDVQAGRARGVCGGGHHVRREHPDQHGARDGAAVHVHLRRADAGGAAGAVAVRHQAGTQCVASGLRAPAHAPLRRAGVHTVWRAAPVWRLLPLRRLGRRARLPALPERPQRQLRRLEGDGHRRAPGVLRGAALSALTRLPPQARTAAPRRAS